MPFSHASTDSANVFFYYYPQMKEGKITGFSEDLTITSFKNHEMKLTDEKGLDNTEQLSACTSSGASNSM